MNNMADPRLKPPDWQPPHTTVWQTMLSRLLIILSAALAARYFVWLVNPDRRAQLGLYVLLLVAECYNLVQGVGFWWTIWHARTRPPRRPVRPYGAVDVFIPTYIEPVEIVEPTVAAATRLNGTDVRVVLLDDGGRPEMEDLADRYHVGYVARAERIGAKAGSINTQLECTNAPFVAIIDCDHVPDPDFLAVCFAYFDHEDVA